MEAISNPKRNGKFVKISPAPFSEQQIRDIKEIARGLSLVFPDSAITTQFEEGVAKINIPLKAKHSGFRVTGDGEYRITEDSAVTVEFENHLGYANDPLYSKDYESKEEQLEVWVRTPGHRIRRRWQKEFLPWEPALHFGYAYEVNDLYEDTVKAAVRQFIVRFLRAYPELDRTSGMIHRENWN